MRTIFSIGVNGSKEECVKIKAAIKNFLSEKLRLELSEENDTNYAHGTTCPLFGL